MVDQVQIQADQMVEIVVLHDLYQLEEEVVHMV